MFVASHRVAGLTFRTESNVPLPSLLAEPFALFQAGEEETADVCHRVHRLAPGPPVGAEQEAPLGGPAALENLDVRLLQEPAVRAWLRAAAERPEVQVLPHQDWLVGRDFARRVLDFYYVETEARNREPEEWARSRDAGEPEPRFRIRMVEDDPRQEPPLGGEERARLAEQIAFQPQEVLEHPLLRAAALRAWLHDSLARGETLDAAPLLDGVVVWNHEQQAMDFFYYPELGAIQERQVADYYRRMFATFLPDLGALLVHSSGAVRGGRAALFLAEDEGGKTTVLRQSSGGPWLNDDQVILRREAEGFVAHATPLGRLTSGPCQAPLGAFFVLEKASAFELEPLSPAGLLQYLWEGHKIYNAGLPRATKMRAYDLFYAACHQAPAYRMRFAREGVDWPAIDAALAGQAGAW